MKELTIYVAADVFTADLLRTYATPLFRYDEEAAQFMIKLKNDSGGYNIEIL